MKAKNPNNHLYQLQNFKDKNQFQTLQFVHVESDNVITDGTTNEEVMKALVARLKFQDEKFPCDENKKAIQLIKDAFSQLRAREIRIKKESESKQS